MDFFKTFGSGNPTPGPHWLPGMSLFLGGGTLAYHFVGFRLWRRQIENYYSKKPWWSYLTTYKGIFCQDVQKEIQYLSIAGLHHIVGGGFMAYGTYTKQAHVWAAGALIGLFDDIHDTVCMILPAWPYADDGKRDVKFISLMLMHHFAAIASTIPTILSGMHSNTHCQAVGAWLLLAGGISHGTLICSRTCNRKVPAEVKFDALIWVLGGIFYTYSRLYAFPAHILALFRGDDYAQLSPILQNNLKVFTALMGTFNLAIFSDVVSNTKKRVKLALFGGDTDK